MRQKVISTFSGAEGEVEGATLHGAINSVSECCQFSIQNHTKSRRKGIEGATCYNVYFSPSSIILAATKI